MLLLRNVIFTIVAPGSVTILFPYLIVSGRHIPIPETWAAQQYLALLPALAGAWVYLRCVWDFASIGRGTPAPIDPPRELIVAGLYQYVRNPIYLGVLLVLLGEAMFFESFALLVYAAIVFVCFHLFVVFYEEPSLRRRFGESYRRYCQTVPRWLPVSRRSAIPSAHG